MADNTRPSQFNQNDLPELLNQYYKRFFPYKQYYQWLSYGSVCKTYFPNREFSFTLKDDIYIRYQSFSDQKEMEKEIQKRCPYKIDIGAVFSYKPKHSKMVKASAFYPEEKELVFDIDMTDYDDVRTCCSGANICRSCWHFITVAMKILDRALEEDFGFEHRLWVYSGRRGVHCWVCDAAARKLLQSERSAIADYLTVIKGGEHQIKKVNLGSNRHPSLQSNAYTEIITTDFVRRAFAILKQEFDVLALDAQEILSTKERWGNVLALVPDETIKKNLEESWSKTAKTSRQRWKELETEVEHCRKPSHASCTDEIMFQYCYPRLDVNVTKGLNHLLKSPFCIHPKTGRICIPIDIAKVDEFNPLAVPTVSQLCEEVDDKTSENEENRKKGYKSVLLKSSMEVFEAFLKKLSVENDQAAAELKDSQEKTLEW